MADGAARGLVVLAGWLAGCSTRMDGSNRRAQAAHQCLKVHSSPGPGRGAR